MAYKGTINSMTLIDIVNNDLTYIQLTFHKSCIYQSI